MLLDAHVDDLLQGLNPTKLASASPSWKIVHDECGPWSVERLADDISLWHGARSPVDGQTALCGNCSSAFDVMEWLHQRELPGNPDAVLAMSQWAGRGQKRRLWHSPPGNLFAGWRWRVENSVAQGLIPLATGLGICDALESLGASVRLKWPNDILISGKKVGGILILAVGNISVIGIGINLTWAPSDRLMRIEGAPMASMLSDFSLEPTPLELWKRIREFGSKRLNLALTENGRETLVRECEKRLAWLGENVIVRGADIFVKQTNGVITGIADDGALILQKDNQAFHLHSGSLFLDD